MPKIIKDEVVKPIAEDLIATLRSKHPELLDSHIRAVLNAARKLTAPVVRKEKAEAVAENTPTVEAVAEKAEAVVENTPTAEAQ